MDSLYNWLMEKANIDLVIVIFVIGSGYAQSRLLCGFMIFRNDKRYDATIKTFLLSLIICGIYIFLVYQDGRKDPTFRLPFVKYFISFTVATSFYELFLRLFEKKVRSGEDLLGETAKNEAAARRRNADEPAGKN